MEEYQCRMKRFRWIENLSKLNEYMQARKIKRKYWLERRHFSFHHRNGAKEVSQILRKMKSEKAI